MGSKLGEAKIRLFIGINESPERMHWALIRTLLRLIGVCGYSAIAFALYIYIQPNHPLSWGEVLLITLGQLRFQIGTLQHLLEMRPYLLYLLPTVQDLCY